MENTENSETDYFLILFSSFTHTKQRRAIFNYISSIKAESLLLIVEEPEREGILPRSC